MKKIYTIILVIFLFSSSIFAQTTETFETESNGSVSFTDNGQIFNITSQNGGTFAIANYGGKGWNGTAADDKFIDNSNTADIGIPAQFTIKAANAGRFKLKSIYLLLRQSDLLPGGGSCTITGKLNGNTIFTALASSGFNTNDASNNGYTLIDLANYGGTNNSNAIIDEYIVTTTGTFEYAALDAMKWEKILSSIDASGTFTAFTSCAGTPSLQQSFSVSGFGLSDNITVTAPTGYQVSTTSGSNFAQFVNLSPTSGVVSSTTIYVRLSSTASVGNASGNISIVSSGAETKNMAVTGTVGGLPTITGNPPNRTICTGFNTTFSVTATAATAYQWQISTDNGANFNDLSNTAPYSNVTATTLNITGATSAVNNSLYRCKVTNNCGPTYSNSAKLTIVTILLSQSQTDVTAYGASNGTATVTPSGGILPYTYSWSPSGGTANKATGLSPGTYTVNVTDNLNCNVTSANYTITQPAGVAASVSSLSTFYACNGTVSAAKNFTVNGGSGLIDNVVVTAPAGFEVSFLSNSGYASSVSITQSGGAITTTTIYARMSADALAAISGNITISSNGVSSKNVSVNGFASKLTGTTTITHVNCNGGNTGSINLTPTGGVGPYTYTWSDGPTTEDRTLLRAGNYSVNITDSSGCTGTVTATVNQTDAISGTSVVTNIDCRGNNTGEINFTPVGGTGPYTFLWNDGATTQNRVSLLAGTYSVTITDANSCRGTVGNISVGQPATVVSGTTLATNVSCNGGSNGTINLTPIGGTAPYSFVWSDGSITEDRIGLRAGNYSVTIKDKNGCSATISDILVTQPSVIGGSTSVSNVSCHGGFNGAIDLTPTGGTAPYTYNWGNGVTTQDRTALIAGTYSVTITDSKLCSFTINDIVVGQPTTPISLTPSQTNILCKGTATGTASVTATGGTRGYTYSWAPSGGTAATATGLTAGTYTVTVTDLNSCQLTQSFTITEPVSALIATATGQTNIACHGEATGSATVSATGGTGTYSYSWAPIGGTASTATGLTAGTYVVTVTDANYCSTTQSFTLTEPAAPLTLTAGTTNNVSCNGGANGTATVNASGGTPGYTYSWNTTPVRTTQSVNGLAAGTYTVTVNDNKGCVKTLEFTITQPPVLVARFGAQTNVSCNGGTNGNATVNVTGGVGNYRYSWSPTGGNAATASGLTEGTYTVTVTDGNSCQTSQSFTITQPDELTAVTSSTMVLCNGGSTGTATVTTSGGSGNYTYIWSPTGGTAATATGLSVGNYICLITDANGCFITKNFTITQPSLLTATTSQINATCTTGGQAAAAPAGGAGGYTYLWAPSGATTQIVTNLAAGSHSCVITDENGCSITKNFTITTTNTLVAATSQSDILCNGSTTGSASVIPSGAPGPFTYVWSPSGGNAETATNLSAGNYSVLITAVNGCSIVKNFTITQPQAITITPNPQTNVTCNGGSNGSASISATGGTGTYTYSWAPSGGSAATANGLKAGTYMVTVKDANNCIKTQSFTITEPARLAASTSQNNVSCKNGSNGSATVNVTGGTGRYSYLWAPYGGTAATASGLAAGTYTVTIKDANLCQTTAAVIITEPDLLTATLSKTDVLCNQANNGTATATPAGGTFPYSYSWSPSGGTAAIATGLSPNTYTVTITDANGCFITETVQITEPNALSITPSQTNLSCHSGNNGSASVVVSGGTGLYSYSWAPSGGTAATATGLSSGTYVVTVKDANNCIKTQSFTITEPASLAASTSQNNVSCKNGSNGSATVNVTGGTGTYSYLWTPYGGTAATASGLAAGTYTATIKDANLCQTTATVTITEPDLLTAALSKTDVLCNQANNGTATATPAGGTFPYSYSWSPSGGTAATATGLSPNTYTVTITDAKGCFITETVQITEPAALSITSSQKNVSCKSGNNGTASVIVSGGTGNYSYSWAPSGGNTATAPNLSAGTYTVTVTDENSCSVVKTITITEPNTLIATASAVNVSCHNGNNGSASATVTGGTGLYTYLWSPSGGTNATANNLAAGIYTVAVTDANLCTTSATVEITQPVNPVSLSTSVISNVTLSGATLSGAASSDGINRDKGECLTEIGFVYATHANPSTADAKVTVTAALSNFTSNLSGLRGNRTYYVRTYAINSNGFINYGNEVSFTTEKYTLSITASSGQTKVYGTTDPVFNYTATGFANGDTKAIITGQLSRQAGENVGKYSITQGSINAGADYTIVFANAAFEITKANQIITWNQTLEFGCDDSTVTALTASTDSKLPVSYTIANNAIGTINESTLTILNSGNTTITAKQDGDQNHNPASIVIKPMEISQSGLITQQWAEVLFFDNKTTNFTAYQWYKNGSAVSGATRQYYSENQPLNGSYYAIAKDINGNSIKSCPIETTGTSFSKSLKIHPNPVRPLSEFTLECDFSQSQLNGAQITIFDITGKLVQTITNVKPQNQITAPSQVAIYVVVLSLNNGQKKTINLLVK